MSESDITVLHVDDDESFASLVADFINQTYDGIAIRTVHNGEEALARLEATSDIACIVSDYKMPGLDGLELLTAVRERWPNLPFLLFTGEGTEDIAVQAINAGVTDYLQKKPGTSQYTVLVNRIQNMVAQHRAEIGLKQATQRTEAQFELLVDTVEDYAIFVLDEEGYIRTWNQGAENIKGYTSDEIVGEHFSIFYRDEYVEAGVPERNLHDAATTGHTTDEGWRIRSDGSEFWADVTITALRDEGDLIGYAKVTRDNTRHHQEELLHEQNEQLKELIATLSHDLRNPLTVAKGNIELANDRDDLSYLDEALQAHDRAAELLAHIGTLAQENRRILEPEAVELRNVAETAWSIVETNGATLSIEEDAEFMADQQRLQQLLQNLFANAIKHTDHAVNISVGDRPDGFYVEDDGPGIPPEERDDVFEMEYSGDPDGSGFGLAICRQIADAHGWTIRIDDSFDGGTRFEISGIERMGTSSV